MGTADNDKPTVSVSSVTVSESSPYAVFSVSLSNASTGAISFTPSITNGSATVGTDTGANAALEYYNGSAWVPASSGVTIAAGSTSVLVRTAITNDNPAVYEGSETFTLSTGTITGTVTNTGAATGTGTIADDGSSTNTFLGTNNTGTPSVGSVDDDRTVSVTVAGPVNEGSTYAMYTVTAVAGYSLDLNVQAASSGTAATIAGFTTLQYSTDGTIWTTYSGSSKPTVPVGGKVYVRVDITSEADTSYEGAETFALKAAYTTNTAKSATGDSTIVDDGSGSKYDGTITTGNPTSNTTGLDDDRLFTVNNVTVNEGSPFAVFTISGAVNQLATLSLTNGTTTGMSGLQYFDGINWVSYTNGTVALNASGTLLVRTAMTPEQDAAVDNNETFTLTATNTGGTGATGTATVKDDGSGDKFADVAPNTDGTPVKTTGPDAGFDDDRALIVSDVTVNEGSPYAVFTVTGAVNQQATLKLTNGTTTGLGALDYYNGTSWVPYTSGTVKLDSNGKLLVRSQLNAERDTAIDNGEVFTLIASNTSSSPSTGGLGTVKDDGSGDYFAADNISDTSLVPAGLILDDDRPKPEVKVTVLPSIIETSAPAVEVTVPDVKVNVIAPFVSALTTNTPLIARADVVVTLADVKTSSSGYQIPVNEVAPPGLNLYRGVTDQFIKSTESTTKVSLPFDAFIHSDKDAVIKLQAKQTDDSPLPNWVRFDPVSGVFEVTPPKEFKGKLDLKVVARDSDGREATSLFQMFIGEQKQEQAPAEGKQSREGFTDKLRLASKRPMSVMRVSDGTVPVPAREVTTIRARAA